MATHSSILAWRNPWIEEPGELQSIRLQRVRTTERISTAVGSAVKNLPANAGEEGLILGSGRSLGEGNGNPIQYSCLGNSTNGGAWRATVHGIAKSQTQLACTHPPGYNVHHSPYKQEAGLGCNPSDQDYVTLSRSLSTLNLSILI